jgi:YidC/Oxa1 family membrane protein insertase
LEVFSVIGEVWNLILLEPMLNVLVVLSKVPLSSFGIAIIVLTIIVRLATLPLTLKQVRSTKTLSVMQPKLKEMQKKYAKDRERLSQETMKIYKEAGVSPLGCMWPMVAQIPIWIALYQSIMHLVAVSPEGLLQLSRYLYPWPLVNQAVPLGNSFLWLDLGQPDPYWIMAILVFVTMFVQQKMLTMPAVDPSQERMNRMMLWFMPGMMAYFTIMFPSGLALFWVASNIIGIVIQGYSAGWESVVSLVPSFIPWRRPAPAPQVNAAAVSSPEVASTPEATPPPGAAVAPAGANPASAAAKKRKRYGKRGKRKDHR